MKPLPDRIIVIVKPASKKNEILDWSPDDNTLKVAIAAPADKDKANMELLKYLRKEYGKSYLIKSGKSSRKKILEAR